MIYYISILVVTTILAVLGDRKSAVSKPDPRRKLDRINRRRPRRHKTRVINYGSFLCILAILISFVGLRASFNDTEAYKRAFNLLGTGKEAFDGIEWALAKNPGFHTSNVLIKTTISEDTQVMLFIYAFITLTLFFCFYRRWSCAFWLTLYIYIAGGMLLFSMAAIKQVLAMSIGLCGITCYLINRRVWFVSLVLLGSLFHAYLPFYLSAFLLSDQVWSRKVLLIVVATALSGFLGGSILQIAYSATEVFGADYSAGLEDPGQGLNLLRFIVYSVTPLLTWIYREQINETKEKGLILFSNFALIGWCFMFFGLFGAANMFARMAIYFDPFMHLALSSLVMHFIPLRKRYSVTTACLVGYGLFMLYGLYSGSFEYRSIFT